MPYLTKQNPVAKNVSCPGGVEQKTAKMYPSTNKADQRVSSEKYVQELSIESKTLSSRCPANTLSQYCHRASMAGAQLPKVVVEDRESKGASER